MNHSERVTELRKQIRAIDALLAKCAVPGSNTETQLEELYSSAQHFLKESILVQDRFKRKDSIPELPDFDHLEMESGSKPDSTLISDEKSDSKQGDEIPASPKNPKSSAPLKKTDQDSGLNSETSIKKAESSKEKEEQESSKVAQQGSQRLADKIHRGQVKDLRKALPLHEKYRFINELFKGNSINFDAAMNHFENSGSSEKALLYLSEIKTKEGWDSEHPLLEKLIELIEKRFS